MMFKDINGIGGSIPDDEGNLQVDLWELVTGTFMESHKGLFTLTELQVDIRKLDR